MKLSHRTELFFLIGESAIVFLCSYFFWPNKEQLDIPRYFVVNIALIGAVYSTTGYIFQFSFFGQYTGKDNAKKNNLIRMGTMIIAILLATLLLMGP